MAEVLAAACVLAWLMALSLYDIRERRLPNALTLPGAAVVLVVAAFAGRGSTAMTGTLALSGVYLLAHVLAPTAMGAGDVKLALGIGALTGAFGLEVWTLAALTAPVFTALWAMVSFARGVDHTVPHGFSMCLASAAVIALVIV